MRTLACTVAAAALLLAAPVALAHQGNPNYRSVVKSVTPETSGIDARILNFDDAVLVHNTSGKDVVILDYKKQPYVEMKADGTVSVNTNSEAHYLNEDRQGETAVPKGLGSEPKWEEVSKSGRFIGEAAILARRRATVRLRPAARRWTAVRERPLGSLLERSTRQLRGPPVQALHLA